MHTCIWKDTCFGMYYCPECLTENEDLTLFAGCRCPFLSTLHVHNISRPKSRQRIGLADEWLWLCRGRSGPDSGQAGRLRCQQNCSVIRNKGVWWNPSFYCSRDSPVCWEGSVHGKGRLLPDCTSNLIISLANIIYIYHRLFNIYISILAVFTPYIFISVDRDCIKSSCLHHKYMK